MSQKVSQVLSDFFAGNGMTQDPNDTVAAVQTMEENIETLTQQLADKDAELTTLNDLIGQARMIIPQAGCSTCTRYRDLLT